VYERGSAANREGLMLVRMPRRGDAADAKTGAVFLCVTAPTSDGRHAGEKGAPEAAQLLSFPDLRRNSKSA
jgi:hypothetical protein